MALPVYGQMVSRTELRNTNNTILLAITNSILSSNANRVVGPASVTADTIPRYNGTTGKIIKSTGLIISDTDELVFGGGQVFLSWEDPFFQIYDGSSYFHFGNAGLHIGAGVGALSMTVTNFMQLPVGAAPTTDAFGEIAGDNNAWAASRGAVQHFDGTANTYLVGTLVSDTPSNGQVPKWNTGGTVTWEDDTGGAASISTNENQFGAQVTITIKDGVLLTNVIVYTAFRINTNAIAGSFNLHGTAFANALGSNSTSVSSLGRLSTGEIVETPQASNRVVVAAGTGGITVTPSGANGVMTFTVNDDDAGTGSQTPWTSDIDADGFALTNVLYIQLQGDGSALGEQDLFATNGNDRITFSHGTNTVGTNVWRFTPSAGGFRVGQVLVPHAFHQFGPTNVTTLTNVDAPWQTTNVALTVLAANPSLTNSLVGGWGNALVTNSGVVSVVLTNRAALVPTNNATTTVGFSDAENVQIYNTWFHLTTNLVVSPTNLIVGRTICVRFDTNALTFDVVVTNTAANPVNWNFNVATNGSTSFTKTNSMRARLYLTAETNGVISADFGYYR